MVEISEELIEKIKRFITEAEKTNIRIEQAILFGSYAHGRQDKWSDIDLALVSGDFEGNRYKDLDRLTNACLKVGTDISPLPYRPDEFTPDDLFVREILISGIRIL